MTMPAPYSYDLRSKAIEAVKRGERKITVCKLFNISRNTRLPVAKTGRGNRGMPSDHPLSARKSA